MIEVKHYKPGDAEFDEIAKTVTHVTKVKGVLKNLTFEDGCTYKPHRRRENVNKIR